ncbi:MAG: hypothetical protein AABW99_00440 [archaeon]
MTRVAVLEKDRCITTVSSVGCEYYLLVPVGYEASQNLLILQGRLGSIVSLVMGVRHDTSQLTCFAFGDVK